LLARSLTTTQAGAKFGFGACGIGVVSIYAVATAVAKSEIAAKSGNA
jgi:hypothetical protein